MRGSLTGMLLLALRESSAMGALLVVHLGMVAGLFLTALYGKFAHVVYRYAALVRNSIEQRRVQGEAHRHGATKSTRSVSAL